MKNKIIYIISIIILLTSCKSSNVVQNGFFSKRKYNKGWNANFGKKNKTKTQQNKTTEATKEKTKLAKANNNKIDVTRAAKSYPKDKIQISSMNIKSIEFMELPKLKIQKNTLYTSKDSFVKTVSIQVKESLKLFSPLKILNTQPELTTDNRKTDSNSLWSFIFAISPSLTIGFGFGFGFGLALLIPALILGVSGLFNIKQHADKYKGKGYAITGIVISIIVLLIYFGNNISFIY